MLHHVTWFRLLSLVIYSDSLTWDSVQLYNTDVDIHKVSNIFHTKARKKKCRNTSQSQKWHLQWIVKKKKKKKFTFIYPRETRENSIIHRQINRIILVSSTVKQNVVSSTNTVEVQQCHPQRNKTVSSTVNQIRSYWCHPQWNMVSSTVKQHSVIHKVVANEIILVSASEKNTGTYHFMHGDWHKTVPSTEKHIPWEHSVTYREIFNMTIKSHPQRCKRADEILGLFVLIFCEENGRRQHVGITL